MMTREEAIKWLEETIQDTDTCWESCSAALQNELDEQKEVFLLALSALRPVSREQVKRIAEPCEFCGEWICGDCTPREQDAGYKIYAGYIKQVAVDDFLEDEIENLNFCPVCGRPMTDEAVEMVMERLEKARSVKE